MLLLKLSDTQSETFDKQPEAGMGLHFAQAKRRLCLILSGQVLMVPGDKGHEFSGIEAKEKSKRAADKLWFRRDSEISEAEEEQLLRSLGEAPAEVSYLAPTHPLVMGFILKPIGYLPPTPARPAYIYGHLPFDGTTQANDVFYRCEHWPTSRRVLRQTAEVLPHTYGFPKSERRFVPTGFAAVGRYALPNLPPACRRYELRPPSGYILKCGAAVPLYGQAGGGVEVMFPTNFTNRVPIPTPKVLEPL